MEGANAAACFSVLALLTACAGGPSRITVPVDLVPAGEREVERLVARGTQTYECRATPRDAGSSQWVYVAADLELTDVAGRAAGRHTFAPPIWQAPDGSRLTGAIRARADAPEAANAPWLLVATRSVSAEGRFSKVTSLQRLNTRGGIAPTHGCDLAKLGVKERVPLIAEFVLFTK